MAKYIKVIKCLFNKDKTINDYTNIPISLTFLIFKYWVIINISYCPTIFVNIINASHFNPAGRRLHDGPFSWPLYMDPAPRREGNDYAKKKCYLIISKIIAPFAGEKWPVFPTFPL